VCADGNKLPPYIIFKAKSNYAYAKLKNNFFIKDKKIFINFNENAWSTNDIMLDWIELDR